MTEFAIDGLFTIVVLLGSVVVAWLALQELHFDKLLRHPGSPRAKLLHLLLAVALGYLAGRFVLDYWSAVGALRWLAGSG